MQAFCVAAFLLLIIGTLFMVYGRENHRATAEEGASLISKELGTFNVDGYVGLLVRCDNSKGDMFDFFIEAVFGGKSSEASGSGSVLLLPEGEPAYWAQQTIPSGFVGDVFISLNAKTVGQWSYERYNKVFTEEIVGEAKFIAWSTSESVSLLSLVEIVDADEETALLAETTLQRELFETGGMYANSVKPALTENYKEGLYVKGTTEDTWIRFFNMDPNSESGAYLDSTDGTYGVAFRIKNLSSEVLRMQISLMDKGGIEYTTSRWYDYPTDDFYLTLVNKEGNCDRVYNAENFSPNTSSASYLHIPANADGILVIPWNMFLNYSGYYTINGFAPERGEVSGKIDSVHHFRFYLTNSQNTEAWERGFFVGSVYTVNLDGTMTKIANPLENYANSFEKYGTNGVLHYATAGSVSNAVRAVMPDSEGIIASSNIFPIRDEAYCFKNEKIVFNAQYGYTLQNVSLSGVGNLEKNEDGLYSFTVDIEKYKGWTLWFSADMAKTGYTLGQHDVTGKTGMVFNVDNIGEDAFDFTVAAVSEGTTRTADGRGSVLLIPEDGVAYWSAQRIPKDFKGQVYLPFNATWAQEWKGARNNVVFDGTISGTADFTLYVEMELKTSTEFGEGTLVDVEQEKELVAKTTLSVSSFEENGCYYSFISDANGEYYKDGIKIQGTNPAVNQWVRMQNVNLSSTEGTLGLAIRVVNLSESRLPFRLFALTFGDNELGTVRDVVYDNEQFYLVFVHTDGRVEKIFYEANGYFYLPAEANGSVILPWNMMLGYQGEMDLTGNDPVETGRIQSVYLLRWLHGRDLPSDLTWNNGFVVGSVYTVNVDGTMTKVYSPENYVSGFTRNSATAERFPAAEIHLIENHKGGTKLDSPGSRYYVGDTLIISSGNEYNILSVKINDVAIEAENGIYKHLIEDDELFVEVNLQERKANVSLHCNIEDGAVISAEGKVLVGTRIEISANNGFAILEVKLNGTILEPEDGKYFYTVAEEDINQELNFDVSVKVTTANVSFECDVFGGAQISEIGPLAPGTVITIEKNEGYEILKVELNGTEIKKEDDKYTYIVQESDTGKDLIFRVNAEKISDDENNSEKEPTEEKGCKSTVLGSSLVLASTAVAVVMLFVRKKSYK